MISFDEWSDESTEEVNGYRLRLLTLKAGQKVVAEDKVAAIIPGHYASYERLEQIFNNLGKDRLANYIRDNIPTLQSAQSGDLGEIFATEYIRERMNFCVPINKLRWRDHREMALRGDDVIGLRLSGDGGSIQFLKCEAKSRAVLSASVVKQARDGLADDDGLPSPHALTFVANRLFENHEEVLSDAIDKVQLRPGQVEHLIFTFSGNDPVRFLQVDLENYEGTIPQNNVGLKIDTHQKFIKHVFEKASDI
ncbi:MAG: DUF1837 domain-containing protein [Proteobacteria bacterium]|nr:DUF1837 domain-containing protein [Pseudomonadota bacterium]